MQRTIKNIVITGPESTGKTDLCQQLASHYHTIWIPEYARFYIENLNRPYTYDDLNIIVKRQFEEITGDYSQKAKNYVFFDTSLIISKVWFEVVYKKVPPELEQMIAVSPFDLFLLCTPDLEWKPDNVRENGGEMRLTLFRKYENELILRKFSYEIVTGIGNQRLQNALHIIETFFTKKG